MHCRPFNLTSPFLYVEYPEAKEFYTNAIKICPDDFTKEKSIFHANRAACLVKMVCTCTCSIFLSVWSELFGPNIQHPVSLTV